jgi:site-specific recombinase XerD
MKRTVFSRKSIEARCMSGSDAAHLKSFAGFLREHGYASYSVNQYVRECDLFCFWLKSKRLSLSNLKRQTIRQYLTAAPKFTRSKTSGKRRATVQAAVLRFVKYLKDIGEIAEEQAIVSKSMSAIDVWLFRYRQHMNNVRGLSTGTQAGYCRIVSKFLRLQFPGGDCDWSKLSANGVWKFISQESAARKGCGPQNVVSSIRSFLRFLISEGLASPALQYAIHGRKRYPQAPPQRLSEEELHHLLATANDGTSLGKRNFAILLLLSQLGLRAGEVLSLQLGDIDWLAGSILIRSTKTRRERNLPLPASIARALLSYLRTVRPQSRHRQIFLEISAPFQPLQRTPAITFIVKCLLKKIGIERHRSGAHLLRHSMATHLVNHGASFFGIADLLGHRSLRTTGMYAKLDFQNLSRVSLPWPEVHND